MMSIDSRKKYLNLKVHAPSLTFLLQDPVIDNLRVPQNFRGQRLKVLKAKACLSNGQQFIVFNLKLSPTNNELS